MGADLAGKYGDLFPVIMPQGCTSRFSVDCQKPLLSRNKIIVFSMS